MRHDEATLPQMWKYYKKAYNQQKNQSMEQPPPQQLDEDEDDESFQVKRSDPKKLDSTIFKFFDGNMNTKFQKETQKVMIFIEKAYKVKVKKIVTKFIINVHFQIIFQGCQQLYVDVPPLCKRNPTSR